MQNTTPTNKKRTVLGRGLDALIPLEPKEETMGKLEHFVQMIPVDSLYPNPYQPRHMFSDHSLNDLSLSIKENGVIQPIIVRLNTLGSYEIVAGERRWRAAKLAGFDVVPALVRNMSDSEVLETALIENLQREDLNPLDTAEAYDTLVRKFSYTQEALAKKIGKDRTTITNHLRLLRLPEPIKEHVRNEILSMGHARTLLAVEDLTAQLNLSNKVVKRRLSVRELEKIVQNFKEKRNATTKTMPTRQSLLQPLELNLSRYLSTKVSISMKNNSAGRLEIFFHSPDELNRILDLIRYQEDFS